MESSPFDFDVVTGPPLPRDQERPKPPDTEHDRGPQEGAKAERAQHADDGPVVD